MIEEQHIRILNIQVYNGSWEEIAGNKYIFFPIYLFLENVIYYIF